MKKVAIIGTQGVPARYGGFETLVENIIGENCSKDVKYTVFCSAKDYKNERHEEYKGAKLRYVPIFHANGAQSTPYDILSMFKVCSGYDVVVILGVSGCVFLPFFRLLYRKKLIINIDGLEHRREKWGKFAKWFLRTSEAMAVRFADVVIADNKGIQDYVTETYHKESVLIAYGGDHVKRDVDSEKEKEILDGLGLCAKEYAFTVCRIEPENNCHITLEAFAKSGENLVFVGNWERSEYGRTLKHKYGSYRNIKIIDPIYNLDILYVLRKNCRCYVHGHSAGGTNPSLVEAMFFGVPVVAFDVVYNRETTHNKAAYFNDVDSLANILHKSDSFEENGKAMVEIAKCEYTWKRIAEQYEKLYL